MLRKGKEDRPEEALAKVHTGEEAEQEEARKEKKRQVLAMVHSEPIKGIPETLMRERKESIIQERLERYLLATCE